MSIPHVGQARFLPAGTMRSLFFPIQMGFYRIITAESSSAERTLLDDLAVVHRDDHVGRFEEQLTSGNDDPSCF
jgi:hypothetical protein